MRVAQKYRDAIVDVDLLTDSAALREQQPPSSSTRPSALSVPCQGASHRAGRHDTRMPPTVTSRTPLWLRGAALCATVDWLNATTGMTTASDALNILMRGF